MTQIAVVYATEYGSAEQYARWIGQELGADVYEIHQVYKEKLETYRTVIYGGGLYYGRIKGFSRLKRLYPYFRESNLVVFTVGLTPLDQTKILKNVEESNLSQEMKKKVRVFHLKGRIDYASLKPFHRLFCGKYKEKQPNSLDRSSLQPLIKYVRSLT